MVCQLQPGPKQHSLTLPNFITVSGMALTVWAICLVAVEQLVSGLIVFTLAAVTDFLDGWAARTIEIKHPGWGVSEIGKKLDPLRDKMLIGILIPLSLAGGTGLWWPIIIIIWEAGVIFFVTAVHHDDKGWYVDLSTPVNYSSRIITLTEGVAIFSWLYLMCLAHPLPAISILFMIGLSGLAIFRFIVYWLYRRMLEKQD